jgi:glucose-1-phosphate adenylyltransferase
MLDQHVAAGAELSVATIPVTREACRALGIMQLEAGGRIARFVEKPKEPALVDSLRLDPGTAARVGIPENQERFLASMGIYIFNRELLFAALDNDLADFGKHIIPRVIPDHRVFAHIFQGYWEDIGTIRSFFEANLDLVSELPRFNFFDSVRRIYTRPRFLPPSKVNGAEIDHAIVSDGCILTRCRVHSSIVGLRCLVDEGSRIDRSVIMGADFFESADSIQRQAALGQPRIGIGRHTVIENAIIDKNARIGDHCVLTPAGKPADADHPLYYIRDGILIVPRDGVIPHGTVI